MTSFITLHRSVQKKINKFAIGFNTTIIKAVYIKSVLPFFIKTVQTAWKYNIFTTDDTKVTIIFQIIIIKKKSY